MSFPGFTLGLAVTDPNTGAGACAVSGATPGRTVNVYSAPWTGRAGAGAWTLGGSGAADGAGSLSLTVTPAGGFGFYQWAAVQLDATGATAELISPAVFRPLVDAARQSVWDRCVAATVTWVNTLNLDGLPSAQVAKEWWPRVRRQINPRPPCCLVSPIGAEEYVGMLNDRDDVAYPVIVVLVDKVNLESQENMTRDLLWREQVSRAFRFQRLSGVPEIYNCQIVPDVVVNPDAYDSGLLVSALVLKFVSREPRGVGA